MQITRIYGLKSKSEEKEATMVAPYKRKRRGSFAKAKSFMKEYLPSILIAVLCLVLVTLSTATGNWYDVRVGRDTNITNYKVGLWRYSSEEKDLKDIHAERLFNDLERMIPAVIVVLFLHFVTVICLSLHSRNILMPYAIYMALLSVILSIILSLFVVVMYCKTYQNHRDQIKVKIGWSFILMVIDFILQVIAIFLLSYTIHKDRKLQRHFKRNLKDTKLVLRHQKSLFVNGRLSDTPGLEKETNEIQEKKNDDVNASKFVNGMC